MFSRQINRFFPTIIFPLGRSANRSIVEKKSTAESNRRDFLNSGDVAEVPHSIYSPRVVKTACKDTDKQFAEALPSVQWIGDTRLLHV